MARGLADVFLDACLENASIGDSRGPRRIQDPRSFPISPISNSGGKPDYIYYETVLIRDSEYMQEAVPHSIKLCEFESDKESSQSRGFQLLIWGFFSLLKLWQYRKCPQKPTF